MTALTRSVAGVAAVVVLASGALTSCAVTGSPATADPAVPTLESAELPQPAPPARPRPVPAASTGSDEAAIRQVVLTYYAAYNAEDWDTVLSVACPASHPNINDAFKRLRATMGPTPTPVNVTAVTVTGDTAYAAVTLGSVATGLPLRRGGSGWQLCAG